MNDVLRRLKIHIKRYGTVEDRRLFNGHLLKVQALTGGAYNTEMEEAARAGDGPRLVLGNAVRRG